jgi:hypothetical protein
MSDSEQVVHNYEPETKGGSFVMRIAKEGMPTVDGRKFDKGSITWRQPPLSLMYHRQNDPTGRGGHKSSTAIASITDIWADYDDEGYATVYGRGYFSTDEEGQTARKLIKEGVISGVSADIAGAMVEELAEEDGENGPEIRRVIKSGEIVAVTVLPIQAFDDVKISVTAAAVTAAVAGWKPKKDWFSNPQLDGPTPLTVTADGRVFGHVATWGTCHVGFKDRCVTPPRSKSGYQFFNVGNVLTEEGDAVSVGRLTAGTGHASIEFGAQPAAAHYDDTGWAAAYVHSGEDEHGIWVAGTVSPTATEEQIAILRASSVSGDWRSIQGALELVGVLAVNSPGFPVPRARAGIVAGAQVSLVAAGIVTDEFECDCEGKKKGGDCDCDKHEESEELSPDQEESTEIVELQEAVEELGDDFEAELVQWDVEVLFPAKL